jgi:hypothetical protein
MSFVKGHRCSMKVLFGAVKSMLHKREGSKQRAQVAADLMKQYHVWLGKMDRQGTMADIEAFLRQEHFTDGELDTILGPAAPAQQSQAGQGASAEAPAEDEPEEEEPEAEEPEQGDEEEDDTYHPEQGKPVPADLDQKIKPYGDLQPGAGNDNGEEEEEPEAEEAPAEDGKEYHGVEKNYKDEDGNWDHEKIQAQLEKLGPGSKFVLGNHRFSLQDKAGNDDVVDEPIAAESIVESVLLEYGPRVGGGQLRDIFNKAAVAFIAKNGGRQASTQRTADASGGADQDKPRGGAGGGSKGGQGPYDIDVMWNILQQNHINKGQITKLMKKVAGASSVSPSLSDQDMAVLGMLGFAFLKSGL